MVNLRGGRSGRHLEDNRPPPDPVQQILERLNEQQRIMYELRETQNRQEQRIEDLQRNNAPNEEEPVVPPIPQQTPPADERETLQYWVSKFCKYQPPAFIGKVDVQVAEDWIMQLEKIFRVLECSTERKAQMAIYKLEGDANRWWENTELVLQARNIPVTWELFKEKFNEKYFPYSIRDEKEAEFLTLQQAEEETFDDYLAKFIRLSRYYTHLNERNDERWLTGRLIRGLKPIMKERLVPRQLERFDAAVEICRLTESCMQPLAKVRAYEKPESSSSGKPPQKRKNPYYENQGGLQEGFQQKNQRTQQLTEAKTCNFCGRNHGDKPCLMGQNVCYKCKKPGHYARECPQKNQPARPNLQGQVFVMTHELRQSPDKE